MPDPKSKPELPNRTTHGDGAASPTPNDHKPTGSPTSERQDSETSHHGQHEERPGKSSERGGKPSGG